MIFSSKKKSEGTTHLIDDIPNSGSSSGLDEILQDHRDRYSWSIVSKMLLPCDDVNQNHLIESLELGRNIVCDE